MLIPQSSKKSRILREPRAAKPFTSSREKEKHARTRAHSRARRVLDSGCSAHAHCLPARPRRCTQRPARRPGHPGESVAQKPGWQPRSPAAASAEAVPGPWLPAAPCSGNSYRPTRSNCTPRCSKEAVRARGRGLGLYHRDGSYRAAQTENQRRPPRGRRAALAPLSLEGSERFTLASCRGPAQHPQIPGLGSAGALQAGGGEKTENLEQGGKLPKGSQLLPRRGAG